MKTYLYDDKVYLNENEVDEAIIEKIGGNYNNIDVATTNEFQQEWDNVKEVKK